MAARSRALITARTHLGEVGAREADIAQQVIVELHQVAEDALVLGATEEGGQVESHLLISDLGCAGIGGSAYAQAVMNAE
ncbi:MAG: hypothetical protein JWQ89_3942 [Devosia sp.]|nr:hypothetical protein [Devosia sp.]